MTFVWDFVADLARVSKDHLEIKETLYVGKPLKKIAIYAIIKKVENRETTDDQRHLNGKKHMDPGSHHLCRRRR
jgi:hypothetical protein